MTFHTAPSPVLSVRAVSVLTGAAAASLALHLLFGSWVLEAAAPAFGSAGRQANASHPTPTRPWPIRLVAAPHVPAPQEADVRPPSPPALDAAQAHPLPHAPQPAPGHASVGPDAAPRTGHSPSAAVLPAYRDTDEVDEPARPISDWLLPDDLPLGSLRLAARVYVSRDGQIDRIDALEGTLSGDALEALLQSLQRTPMRPARLGGRPVAQMRTIEFDIDIRTLAY